MKRVAKELHAGRARVQAHPFFRWLAADAVPLERRFVFSPVMIDFIMGFADLNKWFLYYSEPQNDLERAINQHTEEDRTHSRLFYENWYTLALGELASWPAGKMLWWLFHSRDSGIVRSFGMELLALSTQYPDPLVRFPMMEAIEICGDVFFGHTAPVAAALSREDGAAHDYFGKYHRDRETGHLHADESILWKSRLRPDQVADAQLVVDRVYTAFCAVLDRLLDYVSRASNYNALLLDLEEEFLDALAPPPALDRSAQPLSQRLVTPDPTQARVWQHLQSRLARLDQHPFLAWLEEHTDVTPRDKLRGFLALWGVDIAGYKDFNELVLSYPRPRNGFERTINRWTQNLARHGALYLRDWHALEMDRVVRWDAGETIAFYFLSRETEVHRHNMARVKRHAFRHSEPLLRFWLMKALESSGEPLFRRTAPLAEAVEGKYGVRLDYWGDRHQVSHAPGAATSTEIDELFLTQSMTLAQGDAACEIIDTVFDNIAEQFQLSLDVASRQVFVRESSSLPPPRISAMIPAARDEREIERKVG